MTKILIAAALALAATFGTAAFADEGDYYNGVNRDVGVSIDRLATGSIGTPAVVEHREDKTQPTVELDDGDYYDGASRPN